MNTLELADALEANADLDSAEGGSPDVCKLEWDAAKELRRLHFENQHFFYRLTMVSEQIEDILKFMEGEKA